ncbi:hypothetical protein [Halovulum sp. GXIMD14793]
MFKTTSLSFAALLALASCGDTIGEQALIGAGAGAGTAVILDGDVATGAVVGAGANVLFCQRYPSKC